MSHYWENSMDEEKIKELIKEYIKDNLRIETDRDCNNVKILLYLGKDFISSDSISIYIRNSSDY